MAGGRFSSAAVQFTALRQRQQGQLRKSNAHVHRCIEHRARTPRARGRRRLHVTHVQRAHTEAPQRTRAPSRPGRLRTACTSQQVSDMQPRAMVAAACLQSNSTCTRGRTSIVLSLAFHNTSVSRSQSRFPPPAHSPTHPPTYPLTIPPPIHGGILVTFVACHRCMAASSSSSLRPVEHPPCQIREHPPRRS